MNGRFLCCKVYKPSLLLQQVRQLVSHVGLEVTYLKRVSHEPWFNRHHYYLQWKHVVRVLACTLPQNPSHVHTLVPSP